VIVTEEDQTMAVKIRMKRMGRKNRPYYRIVVADVRSPRDGRFIENLGTYDPFQDGKNYSINTERVLYWIGVGALISDAVAPILSKEGIEKKKGTEEEKEG
jgi:small subunit ribosomal protein S16